VVTVAKIGKNIKLNHIHYDGELRMESRGCMEYCACCMVKEKIADPEAFLRVAYQEAILDKLKNYKVLARRVRAKVKDYKQRSKLHLPTSRSF